jgi:hypothetical protein
MGRSDDVTALARDLFERIRNVHIGLGAGDIAVARGAVMDARGAYANLDYLAKHNDRAIVGTILLAVLEERLNSLADLVEHMARWDRR